MATRIVVAVQNIDGSGSQDFLVNENFDEAMNKIIPISQPSSQLEGREACTWNLADGGRLFCHPTNICWAQEDAE